MSAFCWVKSKICHIWVAESCWQTESWLVSQSSFPQSPWWKMLSQRVRRPDHISLVTAQSFASAKPNVGLQEKRSLEWWVRGGNEKYNLTCHESDRAGISRVDQQIEKNTSQTASYSSAVRGELLVSLDQALQTQDRALSSLDASCFLSKDGCRGNGRAAEGG